MPIFSASLQLLIPYGFVQGKISREAAARGPKLLGMTPPAPPRCSLISPASGDGACYWGGGKVAKEVLGSVCCLLQAGERGSGVFLCSSVVTGTIMHRVF